MIDSGSLYFYPNFFGIEFSKQLGNGSLLAEITNMKTVQMIGLHFRADPLPAWDTHDVKGWEIAVTEYFERCIQSLNPKTIVLRYRNSFGRNCFLY